MYVDAFGVTRTDDEPDYYVPPPQASPGPGLQYVTQEVVDAFGVATGEYRTYIAPLDTGGMSLSFRDALKITVSNLTNFDANPLKGGNVADPTGAIAALAGNSETQPVDYFALGSLSKDTDFRDAGRMVGRIVVANVAAGALTGAAAVGAEGTEAAGAFEADALGGIDALSGAGEAAEVAQLPPLTEPPTLFQQITQPITQPLVQAKDYVMGLLDDLSLFGISAGDVISGVGEVAGVVQQLNNLVPSQAPTMALPGGAPIAMAGSILPALGGAARSLLPGLGAAAGTAMRVGAGLVRSVAGKIRGVMLSSGRFISSKKGVQLAKRVGIDAAAAALGITAVEMAQMVLDDTMRPGKRSTGVTGAQLRTTRKTIGKVTRMHDYIVRSCRHSGYGTSSRRKAAHPFVVKCK